LIHYNIPIYWMMSESKISMTWGIHHALGNGIIFYILRLYVKSLDLKFKSNKMIGKKLKIKSNKM
jgi:hypothetical protein